MQSIVFLGDVFLSQAYCLTFDVGDLFVFNLEAPITSNVNVLHNRIHLRIDEKHFEDTFPQTPLAVCLSNNHIMDYGENGFCNTVAYLKRTGIRYFGGGKISENCNNPLIIEADNVCVALLGYVCKSLHPVLANNQSLGVMALNLSKIIMDMEAARRTNAERVVISLHWGAGQVPIPKPSDITLARHLIDAGADLIIGHHAHCIQPYEVYKGRYIFYNIGNFIFSDLDLVISDQQLGGRNRRIQRKEYYWNRSSIAVKYNPCNQQVSFKRLGFENMQNTVFEQKGTCPHLPEVDFSRYKKRFQKAVVLYMAREMLFNMLHKPKIPSVKNFRKLFSLAHI